MSVLKNYKKVRFKDYLQLLVLLIPPCLITGPFLPDFFLTLSSISLLIYYFLNKNFNLIDEKIFKFFLFFLGIIILSSFLSDYQQKSLITSIGYFRFGIFIFVIQFLILNQKNFLKNVCLILVTIFLILFFDAIFQKFYGHNFLGFQSPYGRITSLFGEDVKLGGYIARLTPLIFSLLVYFRINNLILIYFCFLSLSLTFLSGERMSFLITTLFFGGFFLIYKTSIKIKFIISFIPFVLISYMFNDTELKHRIFKTTLSQINFTNKIPKYELVVNDEGVLKIEHSDSTLFPRIYHMYYETALKIFKDNMFLGAGPRTYPLKSSEKKYFTQSNHEGWEKFVNNHNSLLIRELYFIHHNKIRSISNDKVFKQIKKNKNLLYDETYKSWLNKRGLNKINFNDIISEESFRNSVGIIDVNKNYPGFSNISGANNHPHNTYLQLLSETGLFGFFLVLSLWIFCIYKLFIESSICKKLIILGIILNLFPFIFTGNFFNNWLSIMYFYPIGFLYIDKFEK